MKFMLNIVGWQLKATITTTHGYTLSIVAEELMAAKRSHVLYVSHTLCNREVLLILILIVCRLAVLRFYSP